MDENQLAFFQFHIASESMNFTLILKWKAAKDFYQNETKKFFFVFQFHVNIFFSNGLLYTTKSAREIQNLNTKMNIMI